MKKNDLAEIYTINGMSVCEKDLETKEFSDVKFGEHYCVVDSLKNLNVLKDNVSLDEAVDFCYNIKK